MGCGGRRKWSYRVHNGIIREHGLKILRVRRKGRNSYVRMCDAVNIGGRKNGHLGGTETMNEQNQLWTAMESDGG
jgi:hypothetical protein